MEFLTLEEAQKAYDELQSKYDTQSTDLVSMKTLNNNYEKESTKLHTDMEELRKANMNLWKRLPNFDTDEVSITESKKQETKVQSWDDFLNN